MKSYIIPAFLIAAALTACSDEKATQPTASIAADSTTAEVNTSVTVHFTGEADNVVIFPGDESHDYELREESNTGLVVNKGLFTYSYSLPGIYKMVCVATNHANEGQSLLSDTCSIYIHVIDDITEIEKISAPAVLYDEVFASRPTESDWLIGLPRKIKYKTSSPSVSLSQKLKFYIGSETTEIYLDGNLFDANKKYDLSKTIDIETVSNEGTSRQYKLHTLNYGEFKTYSLAGVAGTVGRSEYDYTVYTIDLEVPAGTDLTAVAPEFTLYAENEKVYIGETAQQSGVSKADFSSPVTYRFVTVDPENPAVTLESTCVVTATVK